MGLDLEYLSSYVEIRQLNATYNRLADDGDGDAYSLLFTEDAEFNIVGNRIYRGRKEIASAASATKVAVHITTEPELEVTGRLAKQRVRMLTFYRAPDGVQNDFVATGWYIDELKHTDEGWRYYRRRVELDLKIDKVLEKMTVKEAFDKLLKEES